MPSKIKVTRTRSKTAHIVVKFDIAFAAGDDAAREKACGTVGTLLRELLPEQERQELVGALQREAQQISAPKKTAARRRR